MKRKEIFKITVTDSYDEVFNLSFTKHQYPSLRELIVNHYPEEFGECKGRGLCGTCHIKRISNHLISPLIEINEMKTLKNTYETDINSRLACQIMLNEKINNMTFKIINT